MDLTDRNAVNAIAQLAVEANRILDANARPGQLLIVRDAEGEVHIMQVPHQPFDRVSADLESIRRMADHDHAQTGVSLEGLYISDERVILVAENGEHRWQSVLNLPLHPAFAYLQKWKHDQGRLSQKDFVRLLRTELRENVAEGTAGRFEALTFTDNRESTGQVRSLASGLDTSIHQEVRSARGEDVPETITFHVPVFDIAETRGDQYDVTVYVEYDHDARKFLLIPVHSDLRRAHEDAVQDLREKLETHAGGRYPVYYGQP